MSSQLIFLLEFCLQLAFKNKDSALLKYFLTFVDTTSNIPLNKIN